VTGKEATIPIPAPALDLPLAEIYAGIELD
jgi:hypothetical protein